MRGTIQAGKLWGQIYQVSAFSLAPLASVVIPAGRELLAIQSDGGADIKVQIDIDGTWKLIYYAGGFVFDGYGANTLTFSNGPAIVSDGSTLRIYNSHAGNTYTANYYVYRVQEAEL